MGLLDGIGLLVVILLAIAGCGYCYARCCRKNPRERDARPRRNRRQKNARRKRRRRQHNPPRTNEEARPPLLPNPVLHPPPLNPSLQCTVDVYPQETPLYPPQQFQGQLYPQQQFQGFNVPPPHQPYQNMPVDHPFYAQFPPPPYESPQQQAQGHYQNFGAQSQYDTNFPQLPPPPYDTQLYPQASQQNQQFEQLDKKC